MVFGHDEPLGRRADLTGVVEPGPRCNRVDLLHVGVVGHDERVGPTQFHGTLLEVLPGGFRHGGPAPFGSGQGNSLDPRICDDVSHLVVRQEEVGQRAIRRPRTLNGVFER